MFSLRPKKEQVVSLFVVICLFLVVACILGSISFLNKKRTENLQIQVRNQINLKSNEKILDQINFTPLINQAELTAKSFLLLAQTNDGYQKILAEREAQTVLPIASLTKLMTAIIVIKNIPLNTKITATPDYVGGDGSALIVTPDHTYQARELLSNMLVASDNDSARLLSSAIGEYSFVTLMNMEAQNLGLKNTLFLNVTGLDPLNGSNQVNTSSSEDLANLLIYIDKNYPLIFQLSRYEQYNFCDIINNCQLIKSTNQFLGKNELPFKIIGGKTGQTDLAGKNLALQFMINNNLTVTSIILGSTDNFSETKTLINQINIAN